MSLKGPPKRYEDELGSLVDHRPRFRAPFGRIVKLCLSQTEPFSAERPSVGCAKIQIDILFQLVRHRNCANERRRRKKFDFKLRTMLILGRTILAKSFRRNHSIRMKCQVLALVLSIAPNSIPGDRPHSTQYGHSHSSRPFNNAGNIAD